IVAMIDLIIYRLNNDFYFLNATLISLIDSLSLHDALPILLLAAGHGAAPLAEALLQSREQRQHMLQLALVFLLAGEEGAHGQVLLHRQPGEDAPPLGYHGDALAHDVASVLTDQLLALVADAATGGARGTAQGHQQGGLAGAVGADQGDDL